MLRGHNIGYYLHISGQRRIHVLFFSILIFFFVSFTLAPPCSAQAVKAEQNIPEDEFIPHEKIEILSFDSLEKAERFAQTLEGSGYRALILTESSEDQHLYRVFILIDQGQQQAPGSISNGEPEVPVEKAETAQYQDKELYEAATKPLWNILGRQKRYVHGSVTFSGIYTDNVLNSKDDKQSDFSTLLSPAIWLVAPYTRQEVAPLALSLRSPGGNLLSRQWPDSPFRYQASLYYRADIPLTSSSGHLRYGKTPGQTISGKLLIKGNRFSLLAEDQYEFSYHEKEAGVVTRPGENERYNSNYLGVTLTYETRNRLLLSGGYSYFKSRYLSDVSDFRDRWDNSFFASLSYAVSPKLSLLTEYRFLGISYDKNSGLDSNEHYLLGGISWEITAKSRGLLKAGYVVKEFDHSYGRHDHFTFELQLDHRLTPKTSATFIAYRKPSETDVNGTAFSISNGLEVRLQHILTARLTSSAGFLLIDEQYENGLTLTEDVDSTTYQTYLALQYEFRRWLKGTVGYAYTVKDSSLSELEYRSNTFYFSLTSAI